MKRRPKKYGTQLDIPLPRKGRQVAKASRWRHDQTWSHGSQEREEKRDFQGVGSRWKASRDRTMFQGNIKSHVGCHQKSSKDDSYSVYRRLRPGGGKKYCNQISVYPHWIKSNMLCWDGCIWSDVWISPHRVIYCLSTAGLASFHPRPASRCLSQTAESQCFQSRWEAGA